MRLNPDCVRSILLYIEERFDYTDTYSSTPHIHKEMPNGDIIVDKYFENYDKQEVSYALELLIMEGYASIAGNPTITGGNLVFARVNGLTWKGHELLNNVRNNTVWNAVKTRAAKFGGMSISALLTGSQILASAMMTDPNAVQNFINGAENIIKLF